MSTPDQTDTETEAREWALVLFADLDQAVPDEITPPDPGGHDRDNLRALARGLFHTNID
jgi:hypothetical protein